MITKFDFLCFFVRLVKNEIYFILSEKLTVTKFFIKKHYFKRYK